MPPGAPDPPPPPGARPTCAACQRPLVRCVCALLPHVVPRTRVLLVQHPRERTHPFGTASLAAQALTGSELVVAWRRDQPLPLDAGPGTWLLYPGPNAVPLSAALATERPHTLVAVDGTWHTAPTLVRDHPTLRALPQVRLAVAGPSRYRIRAEPGPECLSTLESLVIALGILEPGLEGLDALLAAFDAMVERQLALLAARAGTGQRRRAHPRPARALPRALAEDYARAICVYGESATSRGPGDPRPRRQRLPARLPLQWVALRPSTGERFEGFALPDGREVTDWHLAHMGLCQGDLSGVGSPQSLAHAFAEFAGPDASLLAWNQSTLDLALALRGLTGGAVPALTPPLKAVVAHAARRRPSSLEALVAELGVPVETPPFRGRAAARVGACAAIAAWLHQRHVER